LEARLKTLFCKIKNIVAKSEEVKTRSNLKESSKERKKRGGDCFADGDEHLLEHTA
jgi:hypothetical protein